MGVTMRTSSCLPRHNYLGGLLRTSARTFSWGCVNETHRWGVGTFNLRTTTRRSFSSNTPPTELTAVDLFSGIGGFSVSLKRHGFRVLTAVEIDERAAIVYKQNFPGVEVFVQDIRSVPSKAIARAGTTVWCAAFDYYPRTVAGKGGRDDPNRDTIFVLTNLIEEMQMDDRPNLVILENVVHFQKLDLFMKMREAFLRLGYTFEWRIYDLARFGIPQHRKRLFMVAVKQSFSKAAFQFPAEPLTAEQAGQIQLRSFLEQPPPEDLGDLLWKPKPSFDIAVHWRYHMIEGLKALTQSSLESYNHMILVGHLGKGSQGQLIYSDLGHMNTQNAAAGQQYFLTPAPPARNLDGRRPGRYIEDPRVSVIDGVEMLFRRLSGNELSSLQGFPKDFVQDAYTKFARRQIGVSVPPPVVDIILEALKEQYYPDLVNGSTRGGSKKSPFPKLPKGSTADASDSIQTGARTDSYPQHLPSTVENELETVKQEVNRISASQLALRDQINTIKAKQDGFEAELVKLRAQLAKDKTK